jgi:hypothetical protein
VNKPGNTPTAYEWELLLSEGHLWLHFFFIMK